MTVPDGGLRIGSWPGPSAAQNPFVSILFSKLPQTGCTLVEVDDLARLDPATIDVLHIHWPEEVFWRGGRLRALGRIVRVLGALRRLQRANVRIVWMVHNTRPHDAGRWRRIVWSCYVRAMRPSIDAYVTLSVATQAVIRDALALPRDAVVTSVNHPLYPAGPAKRDARARLGIATDARVYVFFGLIRPYKGIDELLDVFARLDDARARLIVAGKPQSDAIRATLERAAAGDARIALRLGYVDEDVLSDVIASSDRVVLPFVDYLHSSSLIRSLSQGCVAVTPATPFALHLHADAGDAYLRLYDRPLTLESLRIDEGPDPEPFRLASYSPEAVARQLAELYTGLVARAGANGARRTSRA